MQIPEFLPEFQITESQINALQSIGSGLKTNILKKVKETSFNAQNEISSDDLLIDSENIENTNDEESISVYESLLSKLAEAKGKVELLEVRKEIQSLSSTLSAQQKVALNEIYKIHLQRIKLIEGSFSETPA
jgi:predicted negative regulator of RcsB-dependent stress response